MEDEIISGPASSIGLVPGRYGEEEFLECHYTDITGAQGSIWFGGEPLAYDTTVLFVQFILIFLVTRAVYFFIKPFRQSLMTAQIIAGIIMGPSFLARDRGYRSKLLSVGGKLILNTAAELGFMLHLFLLGVQIDMNMLSKAGRHAVLIGTIGYMLSNVVGGMAMATMPKMVVLDEKTLRSLPFMVAVNSITSFPVITGLLVDLNMLNSEMGRMASFTSMVMDIWSYIVATMMAKVGTAIRTSQFSLLWSVFWISAYVVAIVVVLRPLFYLVAKGVQEGRPMDENHFMFVLVIVLLCGFCTEVLGQHSGVGTFMLGLVVPEGPPFGESIVYKLDTMSTGLLLPAKFVITGLNVNLSSFKSDCVAAVEVIILSGYVGKFLGTLVTALCCSMGFVDALSLALVMCSKGIVDLAVFSILKDEGGWQEPW